MFPQLLRRKSDADDQIRRKMDIFEIHFKNVHLGTHERVCPCEDLIDGIRSPNARAVNTFLKRNLSYQ